MKNFIATIICTAMFAFTGNAYAVNNTTVDAHRHNNHMVAVTATRHCHCKACNEVNHNIRVRNIHANNYVMAARNCNCNTCRDIRHNEMVMHEMNRHNAPHATPAPHHNGYTTNAPVANHAPAAPNAAARPAAGRR